VEVAFRKVFLASFTSLFHEDVLKLDRKSKCFTFVADIAGIITIFTVIGRNKDNLDIVFSVDHLSIGVLRADRGKGELFRIFLLLIKKNLFQAAGLGRSLLDNSLFTSVQITRSA